MASPVAVVARGGHVRRRAFLPALVAALVLAAGALLGSAGPAAAAYPGHDGLILFARADQLYTVASGGGPVVKLTSDGRNLRGKWSPDGHRIAYVHQVNDGARELWVMNADGSGKRRLTASGTVGGSPSWSPDGSRIVYASRAGYLTVVASVGVKPVPRRMIGYYTNCGECEGSLHEPIAADRFVAWSPDGKRIAVYNHVDSIVDDAIYMYNVATGEAREFNSTGGSCCGTALWTDLFFGPTGTFGHSSSNFDWYTGRFAPVRILYPGFASRPGDTGGAPSPDGKSMVFTNGCSGAAYVYTASVSGAGRHKLAAGYQPDWQPLP